jgi:predicted GNAT family acetyltransferase
LRGRHIAHDIVQFALDYALENGYLIIPSCSFVQHYLDHHPEYQQLVTSR